MTQTKSKPKKTQPITEAEKVLRRRLKDAEFRIKELEAQLAGSKERALSILNLKEKYRLELEEKDAVLKSQRASIISLRMENSDLKKLVSQLRDVAQAGIALKAALMEFLPR